MPRSASPDRRGASSSWHRHDDRDRHKDSHRDRNGQSSRRDRERGVSDRKSRRRHESYSSNDEDERERRRHQKDKERRVRETSDERSARKRKKESREGIGEVEAERRAKAAEDLLYSSEANPFNDSSIGVQFRWGKKAEKEKKMGMTPAEAQRRDDERRREAREEIARLNQKRAEREREQALREEEDMRMARMAESAAMSEWVAKEDDFYLEQSRKRAVIRVRENRAKPIDLLAINLKWIDPTQNQRAENDTSRESGHPVEETEEDDEAELEIDLEEPYLLFDNLDLTETEELHQDIQMYLSLEKREHNLEFWRSMILVCDDKLETLRDEAGEASREAGIRSRLDGSVRADMNAMLSKKSCQDLIALQSQVRKKLQSGEPLDVEYWEGLLKNIVVWRAKAKLSDMHEVIIRNRLEHLRRKQILEAERRQKLGLPNVEEERMLKEQEAATRREERERERAKVDDSAVDLYAREAGKDLEEDEDLFNLDEDLGNIQSLRNVGSYDWEDKYRPRKPRYFNKVNTGYEWNKYNQSHYDTDNPPPKVVQGYKFNIFYPDLLDKNKAPHYRIIKEKGNDETCLIVFEAGPPYETIGFRIVNKPWNMSHNRGFKAVFERGVLQLYFQFQRQWYRK